MFTTFLANIYLSKGKSDQNSQKNFFQRKETQNVGSN